ncbi:MAG TPA: hypothetical protein VLF67_01075 [Candidatus Saccharimonas sp.]|nr:hypothetical protein [Candidatus Saccharimonas sp.]
MPVGAIVGGIGAVAGAGASIYGANKAADASQEATDKSLAFQQHWMDQVHGDISPFMDLSKSGINSLMDPAKYFQTSPGYQFRLDQGLGAVTNNKAVNGLLQSGSAMKSLNNYAQGQASQEYGNWWNQQAGLVNTGLQAEGLYAGVGTNATNNMQQATMTNGANQGGAAIATGNAIGQGFGSIADLIAHYNGGGGSGSSSYSTGIPAEYEGLI